MKKTFTILILFVATLFSTTANAQFFRARELPKNDVSLNVGFGNPDADHFQSCPVIQNSNWAEGAYYGYKDNVAMSLNCSYLRNFGNRFGTGLQLSYVDLIADYQISNKHYDACWASVDESMLCIMPTIRFYWLNHAHFAAYTRLAGGIGFHTIDEKDLNLHDDLDFDCGKKTKVKAAYQVSALGIEWGGQLIRGFAEGGYGYQGFISFGVKATFGHR